MKSDLQEINHQIFKEHKLKVFVKRDDLIHPTISGNKWRKSYHLLKNIKSANFNTVLTFGGAYSNHIHAFSFACNELGLKSIGIIRGEELRDKPLNKTLQFAVDNGMELIFVSREDYKKRNDEIFCHDLELKHKAFIVPEGGTTKFAIDGFKEMIEEVEIEDPIYFVPCGSGGTIAGINANLKNKQIVYGVNVLKGTDKDLEDVVKSFSDKLNYSIVSDYHFGGYAKYNEDLILFMEWFENEFGIEIESVYSGKMFYAFFDLVKKSKFKNSNIVLIHTGGLQGKRFF